MTPLRPDIHAESVELFESLQSYQDRSLRVLLIAISLAGPPVALGIHLREGGTPLFWVSTALVLAIWGLLGLHLTAYRRHVPTLLVNLLVFMAAAAIAAHGSVRSVASMVMVAAIAGAGVFLSRRGMFVSASIGIGLLAALNWAESQGMLPTPNNRTGWAVWLTQAAVLVCLVVTVSFGRHRLLKAFDAQHAALNAANEARNSLQKSEARAGAMFRNNPVSCLVQSLERRAITDCNAAFCTLFGYQRHELIGQRVPGLWAHAADYEAFKNRLKSTGRVQGMAARGRRQDGSTFAATVYAEVVNMGDEHMVITMVVDVSAEQASRAELEASRDRFSKAFNFSPLGMTITRLRDGLFMEVNPANERVLGYSQADFAGKTSLEAGVWLSDADRLDYAQTLLREGRLVAYETRMRTKSGEAAEVRIWAEIIELDGEACALSFTLNVAEEKRREAMLLNVAEGVSGETGEAFFRSLARNLAQAIGADGIMVGELDEFRRMHTVALLWNGELQANREADLSFTLCEQALFQPDMLMVENPEPTRMALVPPFQETELQTFVGLPLRDADGTAAGLITAVWRQRPQARADLQALLTIFASRCNAELLRLHRDREIHRLQETLEQRVKERTEQLEYLNRELDAFSYTVSHDLKSPLRAIDGFMHMLREQMEGRLQPDDEDLVQRVMASTNRMGRLITDLLSLARVSQGQLQRMEVDISDLANGVLRQESHRDSTREISVNIESGLSANCDPRMAQVVLENLLGNAWKYTRQTPDARIELGHTPAKPGEPPQFFIRDNGAGFDMGRSDRLFKPFTRLHSPSEFEGTGIGLATVRRIIERHGGQIHAEAAVGQGATFWFSFGRPGLSD